jgi:hypothetical protein
MSKLTNNKTFNLSFIKSKLLYTEAKNQFFRIKFYSIRNARLIDLESEPLIFSFSFGLKMGVCRGK